LKGAKPSPNVVNSDRRAGGHRIPVVTKPEVIVTADRPTTTIEDMVTAFSTSTTMIHGTVAGTYVMARKSAIAKGPMPTAALGTGLVKYLKVSRGIGYLGTAVDLSYRYLEFKDHKSTRNLVKLTVGMAIPFLVFAPGGVFLVIGVSAAEMIWGESIYNLIPN